MVVMSAKAAAKATASGGLEDGPEIGRLSGGEAEVSRQHTNDGVGIAIENYGLADDIGIAAIALLPCRIAEEGCVRSLWPVFAVVEIAAKNRLDAERAKEPCTNPRAVRLAKAVGCVHHEPVGL